MSTLRAYLHRERRKPLLASLVVFITTLAVAGVSLVVGPFAHGDPGTGVACTPIKLIVSRGTWESRTDDNPNNPGHKGMLQAVTDQLENTFGSNVVSSYWVPYKAQAFTEDPTKANPETPHPDDMTLYADSKADGYNKARAAMERISRQCPGTRFVGIGYSQGADINGDIAADIGHGRGPISAQEWITGGNVADPRRGTQGEVPLGTELPTAPHGAAGPREEGYGKLSNKVASVCLEGDLYCALPEGHELAGALAKILHGVGITNLQQSAEKEASTLPTQADLGKTQDGQNADLSSVPAGVKTLEDQANKGDYPGAQQTATSLTQLVGPLQTLLQTVGNQQVIDGLLATEPGSPTHIGGQVLQGLVKVDFVQLTNSLTTAASSAGEGNLDSLIVAAGQAAAAVAPALGVPLEVVGKATNVLMGIQPSALIAQANNIIDGVTKIDFAGIAKVLESLPGLVLSLDLNGLYKALTKIEDILLPLAQNINDFDFKTIGVALTMIPPVSPEAIAANAVGHALIIVDRIDWVKGLQTLRTLQDELDNFKVDLSQFQLADLLNPLAAIEKVFGINVTNVIRQLLSLGEQALQVMQIPVPEGTLTNLMNTLLSPEKVIKEGVSVAEFYASRVHVAYGTRSIDGSGQSSLSTLSNWLTEQIRSSNVVAA